MDENRHQRRGPILHVQNLQLRRQSPRQLQRRFTEKNKSRRIILVRLAALTVNSRTIKKLVTADEEQLHAACAAALKVSGNVSGVANLHINSYAAVFFVKRAVLSDFAIEGQDYAYFVSTRTQRARQCVHDIHQRTGTLQRRSLRADH